jgi:integrase
MARRLTDTAVRALKVTPGQDRTDFWFDEQGLGLRVSKTGRKTWVYVYHFGGRSRRYTLGTYPEVGVADVRALHASAMSTLDRGVDPGNAYQVARAETRNAPSVGELADEYLNKHAVKKKSGEQDRRMLDRDVLPKWKTLKAHDVTRRDVTHLLDEIVKRGAPISANRVLALVRKMFNFGIARSMVEANPCDHVSQPAPNGRRDRVLNYDEIRKFWTRLANSKMSEATKLALKLQLVTAQRKGEIVNAEWDEIDFENRVWTIPAAKVKNGYPHRVYLSDQALEILERLRELAGKSRFWLPSRIGDKPVIDTSIDHAMRENLAHLGIADATPHDLRRTAASMMTSMGVPRLTVSKILNHTETSVTAIYDRHSYDNEKREALIVWSAKLREILSAPLEEAKTSYTGSNAVKVADPVLPPVPTPVI